MRFVHVRLRAAAEQLQALEEHYSTTLGLELTARETDRVAVGIGETTVEFVASTGEPYYHFALLVPGDRFGEAFAWASARCHLLPDPDSGDLRFDFSAWSASACYFLDPTGNIVELIAHSGIAETRALGPFGSSELVGVSELGLVGEPSSMARRLADSLRLEVWDGTVTEPERLAFIGERARTLILSPPGRGWLPTGRPAVPHPVEAMLVSRAAGTVQLDEARTTITAIAAAVTSSQWRPGDSG